MRPVTSERAESLGYDSVWVAEYWAYDAFTPLAAIAATLGVPLDRVRAALSVIVGLAAIWGLDLAIRCCDLTTLAPDARGHLRRCVQLGARARVPHPFGARPPRRRRV